MEISNQSLSFPVFPNHCLHHPWVVTQIFKFNLFLIFWISQVKIAIIIKFTFDTIESFRCLSFSLQKILNCIKIKTFMILCSLWRRIFFSQLFPSFVPMKKFFAFKKSASAIKIFFKFFLSIFSKNKKPQTTKKSLGES